MIKFYLYLIYFLAFSISTTWSANAQEEKQPILNNNSTELNGIYAATEFVFGIHPGLLSKNDDNYIHIYAISNEQTEVRIYIPALSSQPLLKKVVEPNVPNDFILTPSQAQPYIRNGDELTEDVNNTQVWKGRSIIVNADAPIICYVVIEYGTKIEGFLPRPTYSLGKSYSISSYEETIKSNNKFFTPYVDIIGVYDNTKILFKIGGNDRTRVIDEQNKVWEPLQVMSATLNRGDMWLITSPYSGSDLGSSLVTANKPINVLSGRYCARDPENGTTMNYLIENELPIELWGNLYLVPPFKNVSSEPLFSFFIKDTLTTLYKDTVNFITLSSNVGFEGESWYQIRLNPDNNSPHTFYSQSDFNVVQYNFVKDKNNNDLMPFKLNLLPVKSFNHTIATLIPKFANDKLFANNYLSIIYQVDSAGEIPDDLLVGKVDINNQLVWTKLKLLDSVVGWHYLDPLGGKTKQPYYAKFLEINEPGIYYLQSQNQNIFAYSCGFDDSLSYCLPAYSEILYFNNEDTIPPKPVYSIYYDGSTFAYNGKNTAYVVDMPDDDLIRSNIAYINLDKEKSYNYIFTVDEFIPGNQRLVNWSLKTMDFMKPAKAVITFADRAGNDTTIEINYEPVKLQLDPNFHNFGFVTIGQKVTKTFTLTNKANQRSYYLKELFLQSIKEKIGNQGFTLSYSEKLPKLLLPDSSFQFTIEFEPKELVSFSDSVGVSDSCFSMYIGKLQGFGKPLSISANDSNSSEQLSISPNPASNILNMKLENGEQILGINIYDESGKLLKNFDGIYKSEFEIKLQSFAIGNYFVEVITTSSKKFVNSFYIIR